MIRIVYPNFYNGLLITKVISCLTEGFLDHGRDTRVYAFARDRGLRLPYLTTSIPGWANAVAFRTMSTGKLTRRLVKQYLASLRAGDIAYMWPGVPPSAYLEAQRKGCLILHENINTHQAFAREILMREYQRLGLKAHYVISEEAVEAERQCHGLSDYIFSPSAIVTDSILEQGVAAEKILRTTYGLSEDEIIVQRRPRREVPVFLFIGSVSVRKGAHLLAQYWLKAGVNAKLRIIGPIEPVLKPRFERLFESTTVEHIEYARDLRPAYESADIFIFPSLEEGSPIVTYRAMGAGLTIVTSPMGAGGVIESTRNGIVLDPHDEEAWIETIRAVASTGARLEKWGDAARSDSRRYLWSTVAEHRLESLDRREKQ